MVANEVGGVLEDWPEKGVTDLLYIPRVGAIIINLWVWLLDHIYHVTYIFLTVDMTDHIMSGHGQLFNLLIMHDS